MCIRIYYQYNPGRIQTCTVNIHYLLQVADSIQSLGPVWCYWAFPMEHCCSFIGTSVKSRRFPYTNIAHRICNTTQLKIICNLYSLHGRLSFKDLEAPNEEDVHDAEQISDCKYKDISSLLH
jgi:hypothetical protein